MSSSDYCRRWSYSARQRERHGGAFWARQRGVGTRRRRTLDSAGPRRTSRSPAGRSPGTSRRSVEVGTPLRRPARARGPTGEMPCSKARCFQVGEVGDGRAPLALWRTYTSHLALGRFGADHVALCCLGHLISAVGLGSGGPEGTECVVAVVAWRRPHGGRRGRGATATD